MLHVKAWASNGAACVKDVTINVKSSAEHLEYFSASIPSYAEIVSSIESLGGWRAAHDSGGAGIIEWNDADRQFAFEVWQFETICHFVQEQWR